LDYSPLKDFIPWILHTASAKSGTAKVLKKISVTQEKAAAKEALKPNISPS